jgi:hypothetical protein
MAVTKVPDTCWLCGEHFRDGAKAFFIGGVTLTAGEIPERYKFLHKGKVPKGKLRIRHVIGMKPRAAICLFCLDRVKRLKCNEEETE